MRKILETKNKLYIIVQNISTIFPPVTALYFGNEKQVVHYCTKYLDDFPTSYSTLCIRAEEYCKLKKYSRAINDLSSAIQLKPQRSSAWYLRGAIKGLKKSYADAIFDLNKAMMFDPNNCLALKCRAYSYYMLESYEEALGDIKLVIILGCGDETTYIHKINIMRKLKDSTNKDLEVGNKNEKKEGVKTESINIDNSIIEENNNYSQLDNKIIPIIIDEDSYSYNNSNNDNGYDNKLKPDHFVERHIFGLNVNSLEYNIAIIRTVVECQESVVKLSRKNFYRSYCQRPMLENLKDQDSSRFKEHPKARNFSEYSDDPLQQEYKLVLNHNSTFQDLWNSCPVDFIQMGD
ncbi:hypothetical protein Glove_60g44 [Diversispora epigaea]|uniref:Uncharacterized protein n=1 Tax=Diversispora epigaea TaxID=1348612 RepID=A0A397JCJ3_9GLOM|nr:hypothetical protein Glove_60g44 [Diversispora epigaea]